MPPLAAPCPHCRHRCLADPSAVGRKMRCPRCDAVFVFTPADDAEQVPAVWNVGDVLLDLYEVREVFTSGGMGLVYRVRHRGWDIDLAVKCPRPEYFRDDRDKEKFEREAETWVKLGLHPHTVSCYYVRRLGGVPRVFAEYVGGGSLAEWIRDGRVYQGGLARILDVGVQFAWGLHAAHQQGFVHRDVKPGNVLLTPGGIAKVTDFGLARAIGALAEAHSGETRSDSPLSASGMTPAYCSPEQAERQPLSFKTDVWSWAVSVLELFVGQVTWPTGQVAGHALADYLRSSGAGGRLRMPGAVAELLARCFRPDPDERPRDLLEVASELCDVYRQATGSTYPRKTPPPAEALADSLNNWAVSLLDLGKHDEAERIWEKALAADPSHAEATYNLGVQRWRGGRLGEDALFHKLKEVCAAQPDRWLPTYLLAQAHLEQGDWRSAVAALERGLQAEPELPQARAARDHVQQLLAESRCCAQAFTGHAGWVTAVGFGGAGRVFSGSTDKSLRLWDAVSGACLRTFAGHTDGVTCLAVSGEGRRLVSGSADWNLRLWQPRTGRCLRTFVGHKNWVLAVAFRADGRAIFSSGGDHMVRVWEYSGRCLRVLEGHTASVPALGVLGADRLISGSQDATLILWDAASGERLRTFEGHTGGVHAVGTGSDGRHFVSGGRDRTVRLWDALTGRCVRVFEGHTGGVLCAALSPDGRYLLSGGQDKTMKLWKVATGRCLHTFEEHGGSVLAVRFERDGDKALSACGDAVLRLWRLSGQATAPTMLARVLAGDEAQTARAEYEAAVEQATQALAHGDAAGAMQALQKARALPGYRNKPDAVNRWCGLYTRLTRAGLGSGWEVSTFTEHTGPVLSACFSRDGRTALSGGADKTLRLWDVASGRCRVTFEGHADAVTAVALGPLGRRALSGSRDSTLRLWHAYTGQGIATLTGHLAPVTSVCFAGDGRAALSGSADWTARLWDTTTGQSLRTFEGHSDPVNAVALSADGRHALTGSARYAVSAGNERVFTGGEVRLWDTTTGRCLHTFTDDTGTVMALALSGDGRFLLTTGAAAAGARDGGKLSRAGRFRLWDMAAGSGAVAFVGHDDAVTSVCLTGDGRYAVSGGLDRTVRVWDLESGRCARTFEAHRGAVNAVCVSADGRHILSAGAEGVLKLWMLDWDLEANPPADWAERARPYLETFLTLHTPYADAEGGEREPRRGWTAWLWKPAQAPSSAWPLARRGRPTWTEKDFEELLHTLGGAGLGWLRPDGIRTELRKLAAHRRGPR